MITQFVQFISKLFGYSSQSVAKERRVNTPMHHKPQSTKPPATSHVQTSEKSHPIKKEIKKTPSKKTVTKETIQYYQQYKQQQTHIDRPELMGRIKKNIVFLDQLMITLEEEVNYRPYYVKVQDLKTQSEGCFKIVHRIKDEAPYLNKTLLVVHQHTNTISKLLKIK